MLGGGVLLVLKKASSTLVDLVGAPTSEVGVAEIEVLRFRA